METSKIRFEVMASRSYHAQWEDSFLGGPFPDFRWTQMRAIAEYVGNAIANALGQDRSDVQYLLGISYKGMVVIPTVRATISMKNGLQIERMRAHVQQSLLAITRPSEIQAQLFDNEIDVEGQGKIHANAQEFLSRRGGERVCVPVEVAIAGTIIGHVQGTFAQRPPDLLTNGRIERYRATVIMLHSEKREATARDLESRKSICFRFTDRHKVQLGESLVYGRGIQLQIEETLDASGRKMLNVYGVETIEDGGGELFSLT